MDSKQFYEVLPDGRYRFRVDHHTINDFNTCDRYFQFRHMADSDGKVWSTKGTNMKIALGSWWSTVMEAMYNEMTCGAMPTEHHMFRFAADAWHEHNLDQYQTDQGPKQAEIYEKFGGLEGGQLMALEYHKAFASAHFNQWQVIGAETGFGWRDEVPLGEDDKVVVHYGGKPDLVIYDRAQQMVMPLDHKTKDSIPSNANVIFKPHPQTVGYIYAIRQLLKSSQLFQTESPESQQAKLPTKCIIMMAARFRPTDKPRSGVRSPRFLPVYPSYSEAEIEEWRQSVMEKCRRLRDAIERSVWTPRESACHLFYNGCGFRRVCSSPPNIREAVLRSDFVKIEPWQPYSLDED